MKRKYNRPICLDTCLFNNIIGFDGEGSDFSKLYNRERLIKYIKHHGYNVSDYNLYETLRRDDWNDEKIIQNLLILNSKNLNKLKSINPDVDEIIKQNPKITERNKFICSMFKNITDFASDFYSQILIFSALFIIYSILHCFQMKKINFSQKIVSDYVRKIKEIMKKHLQKEFSLYGKYEKTPAQKILNKYYLIVNHLTIEWSNQYVCKFSNKFFVSDDISEKDLYFVINEYINILTNYDYSQEIILENGRKKANNRDNVIYLISNQGFETHKNELTIDEWKLKFSEFTKRMFRVLYDSSDVNEIIRTYYEMNVFDFYIQHVLVCQEYTETIKLLSLIDPNDLIDLCALSDSYEQGFLFVSNDSKINKVINKIYSKEQKEFINLFINYKFDD